MAVQDFDTIVGSIQDAILTANHLVDVKVGSVIRDVFIDVQAAQIELLYSIANNTAQAMSVATALNQQLDRLAYNFGIKRNPAVRASTNLTISIKNGIQVPTPLNIGDQFYTQTSYNNGIVTFINTQYQLLQPGQTQATIPVVSLDAGYKQNVPAYSITQSTYDFADAVYNIDAASGGADVESDANFALRIPYILTGQYINVTRGIINSVLNLTDVNGTPYFVTPDNALSRGQYTLDVYMQRSSGYEGTAASEVAPANQQDYVFLNQPLYSLNPINQVTLFNPATNETSIADGSSYEVVNDAADPAQFYLGSIKANQKLHWKTAPPTSPYTVSYNYDHTIIDAQNSYDVHNELVADTLFKQANAIPIYISANLLVIGGTDFTSTYQNAITNLNNLFNSLSITQPLTDDEIKFALLQDNNILDLSLSNVDTTFQIQLNPGASSSFLTPNVQSEISPLGYYWEVDTTSPVNFYNIVARLYIGKPDIITPGNQNSTTGFNFTSTNTAGISYEKMVNGIQPSWNTNVYPFYDAGNELLILNFTSLPSSSDTLILNLVQDNISTQNLSYLTLAPALVSPVNPYSTTIQSGNPQYATRLPDGLTDIAQATMYKNGVPLNPTTSTALGDYQILSGPDSVTGIINIQFSTAPSTTDIFNFGILNPNLQISYSTSQFQRI